MEFLTAQGRYTAECIGPDGEVKWREDFDNLVTTVGKNFLLDQALAGSSYTAVEYMGLISSVSYSAISAADTMASHAGWLEAGSANAPTYSGNRKTAVWSAAASGVKSLSAALSFNMTGAGTVKGAFINGGSGAVNTIGDTNGTLVSAGLFTGGDRTVANNDTVNVSYTLTLS